MRKAVRVIYFVLYILGIFEIFFNARRVSQKILCFHSVMPQCSLSGDMLSDQATVSTEAFAKIIMHIRRRLAFTTAIGTPNTVILTFDDGIANNYNVIEIFEPLGIKAYFFIPLYSHMSQELTWHDKILLWADYLPSGCYSIPDGDGGLMDIEVSSPQTRRELCRVVFGAFEGNLEKQKRLLEVVHRDWPIISGRMRQTTLEGRARVMTGRCVEDLKQNGHLVGAHSACHNMLSKLNKELMRKDFEQCAAEIGRLYNTSVYCYPIGSEASVDADVVQACRKAGFEYGLMNTDNPVSTSVENSRFLLPRVNVPFDAPPWEIDAILLGLDRKLKDVVSRKAI